MLIIEVEYLTGRAVATNRESRREPEWPPHPQRLFAALVAAYHECEFGDAERAALEWLEQLSPPSLAVSEAATRKCPETYVPVNDNNIQFVWNRKKHTIKYTTAIEAGIAIGRDRKERYFPTVIPHHPIVQFVWDHVEASMLSHHHAGLRQLTDAVAYLGHSTSLVRVAIADSRAEITLVPASGDDEPASSKVEQLRGVARGRLALLEQSHRQSLETLRRKEAPDTPWHRYRWLDHDRTPRVVTNVFGGESNWFVFQRSAGRALPIHACLALTTSVRNALLSACDDPIPEILSGHQQDSSPLDRPHVAFLPLPNVGFRYSDNELHGFAVVMPHHTSDADRRRIAQALARVRNVWSYGGSPKSSEAALAFNWQVKPVTAEERLKTLQPERYLRASKYWATAAPMVFGHYLRKLDESRTFKIVGDSCEAIGLPRPSNVRVSPTAMVRGVPQSYVFPSLSSNGKPVWSRYRNGRYTVPHRLPDGSTVRMRYHVALEFPQAVRGPVVIGAGRYFGLGLCVPIRAADLAEAKEVTA
ncbi:MAG: type I-U CRISPR-associated protein Csb2 [Candidatus Paceibacterota bacterium]